MSRFREDAAHFSEGTPSSPLSLSLALSHTLSLSLSHTLSLTHSQGFGFTASSND